MEKRQIIPLAQPSLLGNEKKYLLDVIQSGWISSSGKYVGKFEQKFSKYIESKYATTTTNGTCALHLIMEAINIEKKEVIVPDLTFAASASSVIHARGKLKLVDIGKDWNINPDLVRKAITKKTKAIMAVHLFGQPTNMDELKEIAEEKDLYLIEDCAEAHGAEYKGKKVGNIGDAGAFSFFGNKIITTGEGGMITSNNKELMEKIDILKNHGMSKEKKYWHNIIGYNYRMTNLQAAIGLAQLEQIEEFLKIREKIDSKYREVLKRRFNDKVEFQIKYKERKRVSWLFPVVANNQNTKKQIIDFFNKKNFETRNMFYPLHKMPPYKQTGQFKKSNEISEKGIILPNYTNLPKEKIQ